MPVRKTKADPAPDRQASTGKRGRPVDPESSSGLSRKHQELKNRKLALEIAAYEGRLIPRADMDQGFLAMANRFRSTLDTVVLLAASEAQRDAMTTWARDAFARLSEGMSTLVTAKTRRGRPRKAVAAARGRR